jgi:hypothetical protein
MTIEELAQIGKEREWTQDEKRWLIAYLLQHPEALECI